MRALWCSLLLLASCTREPSTSTPKAKELRSDVLLQFPGAGFSSGPCVGADASCVSQWEDARGLRVQVLVLPVVDRAQLPAMLSKMQADVAVRGGVSNEIVQGQGALSARAVRMVVPAGDAVEIAYVLHAPDDIALHVVQTTATVTSQQAVDAQLRDLLAFAAWTVP
jgi:hypothetical protein